MALSGSGLSYNRGVVEQLRICQLAWCAIIHWFREQAPRIHPHGLPVSPMKKSRILAGLVLIAGACIGTPQQQPNIVFILADDLTFRDLGCYGSRNVATPNIDRLAAEGMRFTACFQAVAMCSPTRHNLYSGLYPVRSGAYPQSTWVYPGVRSIVHHLRPLGYRVALTGKRHVLPPEAFPFDYLDDDADPDLDAVEKYLGRDPAQPACVFLCFREPHTPWNRGNSTTIDPRRLDLPPNMVDTPETRRQLANYFAEVMDLDASVGKVVAMLDRLGIADDTLLIFAGEQGNAFPFSKWTCYDTGLQSALIARWPSVVAPGQVTDAMVEYVDVVPTLVEAARGEAPTGLDGRSFLPVLRGETRKHKEVVYGLQTTRGIANGSDYYAIRSIRTERHKLIVNLTPEIPFANNVTNMKGAWSSFWETWLAAARTDPHARFLVDRYRYRPAEELYDVKADPYELNNLADDPTLAKVKAELRSRLFSWMKSQGDEGQATEMLADRRTLKMAAGRGARDGADRRDPE